MSNRYAISEQLLERAKSTIPLGSQTFSKSITQFPYGVSPYFAKKGKGAILWDVDGNQYVDFINGLLSVCIGYADNEINAAVTEQLANGVSFSLSHKLEADVAEKLIELVPCAEMVRFGKNGTDSTSAAIRLARAYTGKDLVLVCGYHGWQDWYIGSTSRNLGVPKSTQALTKTFKYNDIESFNALINEHRGDIAAVIMEPMNVEYPKEGFLEHIREITKNENIVMIFDETITGCRFAQGGAQELFGVTPDLATFGKGIGNGFPLSAVMGKKEIMRLMEDIFYSGTFAGETASLAAANVVLDKVKNEGVCQHLAQLGNELKERLIALIKSHQLEDYVCCQGHPSWSFTIFKGAESITPFEMKTYFMQEMFKSGILTLGTHNLSFSHTSEHINALLDNYDRFFGKLAVCIEKGSLADELECDVLVPLFQVR
ncbi:aspartate aminotransferase family protein [Vibrio metoecus]|uniref:aspartate aminotransferase family protein n=1 Tax=Vibrio metoecus TaxID=1481663 RepID=UPI000BA959B3|nr:aminotransferase class III-fold pyridoxal phosphate-dependent enzyme [Vibrio metoecus]PAR27114.1 aspartate aminotransferase family protein [Vibrio metoecus]PAR60963.1 aspartate aminotransferase family protein [Vibrio metoecus]